MRRVIGQETRTVVDLAGFAAVTESYELSGGIGGRNWKGVGAGAFILPIMSLSMLTRS